MAGTDTADCRGISSPSSLVFQVQSLLQSLGYNPGAVDGQIGPRTRIAISNFQRDYSLPQTGQATQDLLQVLQNVY
ncbi:MAG: peptidoglycan-binding protein [Inquilinus sp.]|nr:peptidoglycan-binding protein [Inquilinus sp.]